MSSTKGEGRNLLSSNSVVGANLPASRLENPNVHRLLIPGHLTYPVIPKRISLSSYGWNCPEGLITQ